MRFEFVNLSRPASIPLGCGESISIAYWSASDASGIVLQFESGSPYKLQDNAEDGETTEIGQPYVYLLHDTEGNQCALIGGLHAALVDARNRRVSKINLCRDRHLEEFWKLDVLIHYPYFLCIHEIGIIVFNQDLSVRWSRFKQLIDHFAAIDEDNLVFLTDHEKRWTVSILNGESLVDEAGIHSSAPDNICSKD